MSEYFLLFIFALVGALAGVERRAFLQAMLSQPIVIAGALGLLWGAPVQALSLGVLCQLYFIGSSSVGADMSQDETLASTAIIGASLYLTSNIAETALPASAIEGAVISLGLPLAAVGRAVELRQMRLNQTTVIRAEDMLKSGVEARLFYMNNSALLRNLIVWFLLSLVALWLIVWLVPTILSLLPAKAIYGLSTFRETFIVLALIVAAKAVVVRGRFYYMGAGGLAGIAYLGLQSL